jgi:CAAX prenyl protease-like protein
MPAALAGVSTLARAAWISIRALAAVTTVPIAEELAFRGFLLRRIVAEDFEAIPLDRFSWQAFLRTDPALAGLLISSAAFGALHGSRWIAGTLAGLLFALAMGRRGKLGDAVMAHAVANALLAAYVLGFDQWQLW